MGKNSYEIYIMQLTGTKPATSWNPGLLSFDFVVISLKLSDEYKLDIVKRLYMKSFTF